MKKLLIILLLLVGCDYFFEEEGICVLRDMVTNSYNCYPDMTESHCIQDAKKNESIILTHWGKNYDCDEFCDRVIPNETCEIR